MGAKSLFKQYFGDLGDPNQFNYIQSNGVNLNPVVGNAIGVNPGVLQPNFGFNPNSFSIGPIPTPPDKTEVIFKSEHEHGARYELHADLYGDNVKLTAYIYIGDTVKETMAWDVTEKNLHEIIVQAHAWAQGVVEKKANTLKIFEDLIQKGKEEVRAKIGKCSRKYG